MIVVFVLEMEMACLFVDRWDCCVGEQLSVDIDWDGRGKVTLKNSDRWRYVGWFLRLHSESDNGVHFPLPDFHGR